MRGYATEWVDGYGRSRWQPVTGDGERLWCVSSYARGMHQAWSAPTQKASTFLVCHGPITYKSRARAERVARRRQAYQKANTLHPVQRKERNENIFP